MFESVISNDSHEDDKNEQMIDGSGLMMDEGGDGFGDLEDLASDEMGGFDDDLGDIDEAASDTDTDELEHRLGELEEEVSSLSSTVSTVRSENEQISGSVQEVEENVQKLLDIYEMVTRGMNPFTDNVEAEMGGGSIGDDRSFGLFDEGDDNQEEEIDEDTVNADAEGFFDKELSEDTSGEELAADGSLNETNDDGSEDDGGFFDDDSLDEEDQESGDGTTFQDLKDEYDSGDAEWAEEDPENGAATGEETVSELTDTQDLVEADDLFSDSTDKKRVQNVTVEVDTESEPKSEPAPKSTAEETSESTGESESTASTGKPYLVTLPPHYTGNLIVMEWLEYLIQQAGYRETTRAIEYYETIDWIAKDVANDLQTVVRGFDDIDEGNCGLTIDHHTQSLEYISQLDKNGGTGAVLLSKLGGRGGPNGLEH